MQGCNLVTASVSVILLVACSGFGAADDANPGAPAGSGRVSIQGQSPVNAYAGMQEREEVFAFTQKPEVRSQRSTASGAQVWAISFAAKGNCDATVAVVDKDGKTIRHLASGVLGKNAPYPFQQNTLSQRIEWDGLTDNFKPADPSGLKIKVGLGLKATYDKSINYSPYWAGDSKVTIATDADGNTCVAYTGSIHASGRVYDKDGKYVRTFCPPPAAELEKFAAALELKVGVTKWGDKVALSPRNVSWCFPPGISSENAKDRDVMTAKLIAYAAGSADGKEAPLPAFLRGAELVWGSRGSAADYGRDCYLSADPLRDEVWFFGQRFDGKTGEEAKTWPYRGFSTGIGHVRGGPDGLLYATDAGPGAQLWRWDREGKVAPMKENWAVADKSGWGHPGYYAQPPFRSVTNQCLPFFKVVEPSRQNAGTCITPSGLIVGSRQGIDKAWAKERGVDISGNLDTKVIIYDLDGKLITADALGVDNVRGSALMDRDGNFYVFFAGLWPVDQKELYGADGCRVWGESLVKIQGMGGKYPLNARLATTNDASGAVAMEHGKMLMGALWVFGTRTTQKDACFCCSTPRIGSDIDYFARLYVPANYLHSVLVLDSNGNVITRLGKYGNVDDTESDIREKKGDGIRFAWPRAVSANDWAMYVADHGSRRILRATLSYAAEETAPLP